MYSRYDQMKESASVHDEDGDASPDPLSVNFVQTQFTEIPAPARISEVDIHKFWMFMYKNYALQDHDDVLLTLNNVAYIGLLKPGDIVYKITKNDIENFAVQTKKQHSL